MSPAGITPFTESFKGRNNWLVFAALWLLVFAVYYPAASAGRVGDFPGLYADWRQYGFLDYLNRRWSYLPGMYQLTQLVTWCWFYLFGVAAWPWHLLQVSLHAASAYLLYRLLYGMLSDAGQAQRTAITAFAACVLFAVNPYAAEAVIWEPAYHYPQALALQLLVLLCARKFLVTGRRRWAGLGTFVFLLSAFTLEYFYLTPVYCFVLGIVYQPFATSRVGKRGLALWILLPQLFVLALYFLLMKVMYSQVLPRAGGSEYLSQPQNWFLNPLKNASNVLLHTRAWPGEWPSETYQALDKPAGIIASWVLFITAGVAVAMLFWRKRASGRVILFFAVICILSLWSTGPLQFERVFRHYGDRYIYCTAAAWSATLALLLMQLRRKPLRVILVVLVLLLNGILTMLTVWDWRVAGLLTDTLAQSLPSSPGKTIVLLNVPQVYNGIPLFAAGRESGFEAMRRELFLQKNAHTDSVIEVIGYVMRDAGDGADAVFESDSLLRITLQDWGRWWVRGSMGVEDYQNEQFSVSETGSGHHYVLRMKEPADRYVYYRQQGAHWEEVKPDNLRSGKTTSP